MPKHLNGHTWVHWWRDQIKLSFAVINQSNVVSLPQGNSETSVVIHALPFFPQDRHSILNWVFDSPGTWTVFTLAALVADCWDPQPLTCALCAYWVWEAAEGWRHFGCSSDIPWWGKGAELHPGVRHLRPPQRGRKWNLPWCSRLR